MVFFLLLARVLSVQATLAQVLSAQAMHTSYAQARIHWKTQAFGVVAWRQYLVDVYRERFLIVGMELYTLSWSCISASRSCTSASCSCTCAKLPKRVGHLAYAIHG